MYGIQNVLFSLFWKQFIYKICNKCTFSDSAIINVYWNHIKITRKYLGLQCGNNDFSWYGVGEKPGFFFKTTKEAGKIQLKANFLFTGENRSSRRQPLKKRSKETIKNITQYTVDKLRRIEENTRKEYNKAQGVLDDFRSNHSSWLNWIKIIKCNALWSNYYISYYSHETHRSFKKFNFLILGART